jgi:hypothetical protein
MITLCSSTFLVPFIVKNSEKLACSLECEIPECVYGTMMGRKVGRIFHQVIINAVTKFGDDCIKFQSILSDFSC